MTNLATSYKPASAVSDYFAIGEYILTAGLVTNPPLNFYGFNDGDFITPAIGSITPNTYRAANIKMLMTRNFPPPGFQTIFILDGSHAQDFFSSIDANSITLNSADADYAVDVGPISIWAWFEDVFNAEQTYSVRIS